MEDWKIEETREIYQHILEDLVAFERASSPGEVANFFIAGEVDRIHAAREIHQFVSEIEQEGHAGFTPGSTRGSWVVTPLSKYYSSIGRFQAIFSPAISYSEEVECFHRVCFDMGLSMIWWPQSAPELVFRTNQNIPNQSLTTFLGTPAFQAFTHYPIPDPQNVGHSSGGFQPGAGQNGQAFNAPPASPISPPPNAPTAQFGGAPATTGAAMFNELIARVRHRLSINDCTQLRHARKYQADAMLDSGAIYLDLLLKPKAQRYRVFSLDFAYHPIYRDAVLISQIRKDTAKLLTHKKLTEGRIGYFRKMQFGGVRRHFFHLKIFFEAPTKVYDHHLNEIAQAWINEVTKGKGIVHDCRIGECVLKRFAGDFNTSDPQPREQLMINIEYLCMSERLLQVTDYPNKIKTLVKGKEPSDTAIKARQKN